MLSGGKAALIEEVHAALLNNIMTFIGVVLAAEEAITVLLPAP